MMLITRFRMTTGHRKTRHRRFLHATGMLFSLHYDDVRMGAIASQITSLAIVYSAFYSGVDQRKHQSSASLAFVRGIHRDRWIPRTKGQLRGKCFHLMTSSWLGIFCSNYRRHIRVRALFKGTSKCIFLSINVVCNELGYLFVPAVNV